MTANRRTCAIAVAAALAAGCGSPAFANNGNCLFRVNGSLMIAFGSLDPSSGATVSASALPATLQANEAGDCRNVTLTISADNGQNFAAGSRRLRNGADFIPYSLALPVNYAAPGNNRWLIFGFTATIAGTAYQNASAGTYSDTVVLSVSP